MTGKIALSVIGTFLTFVLISPTDVTAGQGRGGVSVRGGGQGGFGHGHGHGHFHGHHFRGQHHFNRQPHGHFGSFTHTFPIPLHRHVWIPSGWRWTGWSWVWIPGHWR